MITDNDKVILPIGIEVDGVRYREVFIDEMTGIDEEHLSSRKVRNNGAKAITLLLRRCIQEVPGVLERKRDPLSLCSEQLVRNMYVADRDFLIMCIRVLSGDSEILSTVDCPSCGIEGNHLLDLKHMDVYEWDENSPVEIKVDLPRGFYDKTLGEYRKRVTWAFLKGFSQERIASMPDNETGTNLIAMGLRAVEGMETLPMPDDVRKLSVRDRNAFAEAIVENAVGVETKVELCCDSCGHDFHTEVNTVGFSNLGQSKTQKPSTVGMSGRRLRKKT
jgi:hypothetical protein